MDDLKALPVTEGYAGIKNSVGRVFPPLPCKGVALEELCDLVGGLGPDHALNIVAKDGYAMTMSYDQAIKGDLVLYDPGTGDETTIEEPVTVIVAYEQDGKPIPEDQEGPLRVMGVSPKNNQVIDGHWSVKWLRQVVVKSMADEWVLHLQGQTTEEMDRATFESGAAPLCHGQSWSDGDGHKWTGIPLWLLVGRVDDDVKHETRAFNDRLAEAGYTVEVVAADGYSVSFDSETIMFDNELLVAHLMDDQPLESKHFPLRLVGPNLSKREMVSQIAQIVIRAPGEQSTPEPTPEPTTGPEPKPTTEAAPAAIGSDATLLFSGLVEEETTFSWGDLHSMEVKTIEAEHPKQGKQTYQGVSLLDLLQQVGVKDEAQTLVLIAGDGYQAEVTLAELQSCEGCSVAFDEGRQLKMVMPGLPSNLWIKDVVQIDVQ
jgi:DMSO/TMAO reductase YedYZ molybdopterin-dependent catalytic subunit